MREPKNRQKNSPGPGSSPADSSLSGRTPLPSTPSTAVPSPSPSPGQSSQRPPRTPMHEPADNSPWYPQPPLQQPMTPKTIIKSEPSLDGMHTTPEAAASMSNPPSVSMPSPAGGASGLISAGSNLIVPSSPLDQFKKEDPMEKMAQMTSSLGGPAGGSFLKSLQSPSAYSPGTPQGYVPSASPSGLSRPSVITQQPYGAGSRQMVSSPNPNQPPPPSRMVNNQGMNNINHGPPVPEQPYMQRQSFIFVFNTEMANHAADLVGQGRYSSILDYHTEIPETRRFLAQHGNPGGLYLKRTMDGGMGKADPRQPAPGWPPEMQMRQGGGMPPYQVPFPGKGGGMPPGQMRLQPNMEMLPGGPMPGMEEPSARESKQAKLEKLQQLKNKFLPAENVGEMPYGMQHAPPPGHAPYPSQHPNDNPNVMPVPSPQPIQYISGQFDAQELVIQKQPNRMYVRSQATQQQMAAEVPMHQQGQFPDLRGGDGHPGHHFPPGNGGPPFPGGPGDFDPAFASGTAGAHPQMSPMQRREWIRVNMRVKAPGSEAMFDAPRPNMHGHPHIRPPPQTVNNTYINAHMTIEQLNIQNPSYDNTQYSHSQTQSSMTYAGPGMEPVQMARGVSQVQMSHSQQQQQQQRPMTEMAYPVSYEGQPQIAIRPNAPNTIQYLPSRPPAPRPPRAPPNLDFLHQWTGGPGMNQPGMQPSGPFLNSGMSTNGGGVGGGGGGPGGAMYSPMDGLPINRNMNPNFPMQSPGPPQNPVHVHNPIADGSYSSYQDFQQQLYATKVGNAGATAAGQQPMG
ncbi:LOW QUALITY PROTEIN: trithorax group protein osa-like [Paramacrobiotus metropolitanus]|uniref:LOW QUALITY PROTEIN: trithorax group protein osa-like n=1 Tax=Paramacrobiotus metropolitanus TaxID=2943436 RepID=UPI0024462917|nr:LOW QUALITY PROTEIN: trithorax group protein osa-like [Paramacrobiotus metropolitanus]